ncbi:MAG: hypothetical protein U0350_07905 [Caldilineaceae bacterium]
MLTVIIAAYLVLSLLVGIVIFSACVVAGRADRAIETREAKPQANYRLYSNAKRLFAKPAKKPLQQVANVYRSSSLN